MVETIITLKIDVLLTQLKLDVLSSEMLYLFSKVKICCILKDLKFVYSQGDVGCGKTVVAFLACMEVIGAGYQV